ncbi:unnamed protein product [Mytilus edulis]|uniref:Caspase family p20 domain-containing protein n=1 Tax=Mytilus edulis TaxID=6550 RepID=A0A8S3U1F5_MYTED|nr:unnamed protein product [Mytilus edulis]
MVPGNHVNGTSVVKEAVAEVMILEYSIKKELFFFPGLIDVPMKVCGWPDLAAGRNTVRKKDVKMSSFEFYGKISKDRKIYQMTNASNRGKFILISNAQCIQCTENTEDEEEKKKKYSACLANTDFDKSNMSQLLKSMGYELKGGDQVKNLKKEEIIEFLKRKVNEIDSDQSAKYDSLVILFLSGKYECDAGKIYDCDGKMVKRNEILEIIKGCQHFKGKPKVVFVQTYNFQDESHNYDTTDSANDLIKDCDPNKDDIFVVTNYPRIVQGPWILGEDMSGSYFIQALIHVFKQFACEKSFMELLNEANMCLAQAVVPKKTTDDGKSVIEEKKTVAQIAFLECCEGKDLYFPRN